MALIKCVECGKVFSDRAAACPNCACPTEIVLEEIELIAKKADDQLNSIEQKDEYTCFNTEEECTLPVFAEEEQQELLCSSKNDDINNDEVKEEYRRAKDILSYSKAGDFRS